MPDLFTLEEKVVVVTGGLGLVGSSLVEALHDHGATVVVADVDEETGPSFVDDLGSGARFVPTDVTSAASVQNLLSEVFDEYGRLDVLVNAAYPKAENYGQPVEELTVEDWRENLDRHLTGYFLPSYYAAERMRKQAQGGNLVHLGSIYGIQAPHFQIYEGLDTSAPLEYATIKGGIVNLSRYLASYYGRFGVRSNVVSPGGVADDQPSAFVDRYEQQTPLGRMATPDDIDGAVVFLASNASSYVTGHNLVVDGGWTIS